MKNKIVLHYLDGHIVKGTTCDFSSDKSWFHVTKRNTGETIRVYPSELKGIFFVKSYEGNWYHGERYDIHRPGLGRKVMVCFKDGENLFGYTTGVGPERRGFFLFFSDPRSNNEKVFVMTAATEDVRLA
ncbi:MAG: hypothetical protein HY282_12810 [Nitrospirae bacterium]|nr:hypothetical protein [Candidatus Manganitrophaceae bacterium]